MAFALAALASASLVFGSPYIGRFRNWLHIAFPGHFLLIAGGALAAAAAAAILAAVVSIRDRRAARYGLIAAAGVIAVAWSAALAGGNADSNAVERFHFVEYGAVAFLFVRAWRPLGGWISLALPAIAGVCVGTLDEWLQWFVPGRIGEMHDVLLDAVAVAAGLVFCAGVMPPLPARSAARPRAWRQLGWGLTAGVLLFAAFFTCVHLGYTIVDPGAGSFVSRYTGPELLAAAADRAQRWQTDPPIDRTRLAREDQYRTEGLQHVADRNAKWDARDAVGAWRENQILERYFAPVLDAGARWPAPQREDARRRFAAAGETAPYVSDAFPYPVYPWRRFTFWSAMITLAAGVWMFCAARARGARDATTPMPRSSERRSSRNTAASAPGP